MTTLLIGLGVGAAIGYMLGAVMATGARADEQRAVVLEEPGAVRQRLDSGAAE